MKHYNLYYKESKLNNRPLTLEDLENILKQKTIIKKNSITNKNEQINTSDIRIVKTIII